MGVSIIGCMSGSSLDGLDMTLCQFQLHDGKADWSITAAETQSFPEDLRQALKTAPQLDGFTLQKLHADFGVFIGQSLRRWMERHHLKADYIASHGHTVFHDPAKHFTLQIGSGAHIAFHAGVDTITDFRSADIAAGGQGAPFAPVADKDLFPGYDGYINLGGIANISIVTPEGLRKGWDVGPCNQALNHLAEKAGRSFDPNGSMAASGKIIPSLLQTLVQSFPFEDGQPKGLSNAEVAQQWLKKLVAEEGDVKDALATTTEAIAIMMTDHVKRSITGSCRILVTGGGAHNTHLMERLAHHGGLEIEWVVPSRDIVDFKECLLMAWLGYLRVHHQPFGLPPFTGASTDTIGGAIYKAHT